MMVIMVLERHTIRSMFDEENKKHITICIDDLRSIVEWYDSLDKAPTTSFNIKIFANSNGIGPVVRAFVETGNQQGVWKDFTDYDSW